MCSSSRVVHFIVLLGASIFDGANLQHKARHALILVEQKPLDEICASMTVVSCCWLHSWLSFRNVQRATRKNIKLQHFRLNKDEDIKYSLLPLALLPKAPNH